MFNKNSSLGVEREKKPLNRLVKKWVTALTLSLVILFQGCDGPETAFVTEWETTSVGEDIIIPINTNFIYNYNVDWGDGTTSTETTKATHTYDTQGIHTVKITGDFPAIAFANSGDKDKIKKITNWGTIKWKSFFHAFNGCSNLELTATDSPDLSGVDSLEAMFKNATNFNTNINHWDVSSITNMVSMFNGATNFNQPLNSWDTSNVTFMSSMFYGATSFNQPLNNWDTSSVNDMQVMFENASSFTNQDLSGWNVANVTNYTGFNTNWGTGNTLPDSSWRAYLSND